MIKLFSRLQKKAQQIDIKASGHLHSLRTPNKYTAVIQLEKASCILTSEHRWKLRERSVRENPLTEVGTSSSTEEANLIEDPDFQCSFPMTQEH